MAESLEKLALNNIKMGLAVLSLRETPVTLLPHRRAGDLLNPGMAYHPGSPRPGADSTKLKNK